MAPEVSAPAVIAVDRRLVHARDRAHLHHAIEQSLDGGNLHLVLDFSRPGWFGVPILDEVIASRARLEALGGSLTVVGSPVIDRMLRAARVDRVERCSSVQSALAGKRLPAHAAA